MSKIKNGGLDQYGAEPFEQQQFGTAGAEGVNALELNGVVNCVGANIVRTDSNILHCFEAFRILSNAKI